MSNSYLSLSSRELKKTRECRDRYVNLTALRLTKEPDEDLSRREEVKKALIKALSLNDEKAALDSFDSYMKEDYVNLPGISFVEAGDILRVKGERFIGWYFSSGFETKAVNLRYAFMLDGVPAVEGKVKVTDRIDLLSSKEGKCFLINLKWGTNPYSDKARKAENLTLNSIELLTMLSGNEALKATAMTAYLTSKDDTNKKLSIEFEPKPGKNLAVLPSENVSSPVDALRNALGITVACDCDTCEFCKECTANTVSIVEKEKKAKEKKDVSYTKTQDTVIGFKDGALCVVAVPGAGKTFALVERTKALIKGGVDPSKIVMATFTKKAAAEYAARVEKACPKGVQPDAFTLHALAHYIITDVAELKEERKLATDIVRLSMIRDAVLRAPRVIRGISYDFPNKTFGLYRLLDSYFKLLDSGNKLDESLDVEGITNVYKLYKEEYERQNCFEYDDLIKECNELLDDPEILKKVHDRWQYVMVDEVQDIDYMQWEMVSKIQTGNLVIVGDDDQQIFDWRGGSSRYMLNFLSFYPEGKVIYMEDNFRSSQNIISVATALTDRIDDRYSKKIVPLEEGGAPVFAAGPYDNKDMVRFIAGQIASGGTKPEEICVLARKNATLDKLERELTENGIKCISSRNYLIESPVFDMLWCLFKLYELKDDCPETCLYRLRRYMGKECTKETGESLYEKYFKDEPETISKALDSLCDIEDIEEAVIECYKALTGARHMSEEIYQLIKKIREEGVRDFEGLTRMMQEMIYFDDESEMEVSAKEGYVNLLTCHKAKGKEYPFVIVYGVEEFDDSDSDIRLAYVAVTRAKKVCALITSSLKPAAVLEVIGGGLSDIKEGEIIA